MINCSKKRQPNYSENVMPEAKYDTTAVDSFSQGAMSVDVAERIRMSSQKYRDSVKLVILKQEEERKKKEEQDKLEKAAKDALEKEKAVEQAPENTNP